MCEDTTDEIAFRLQHAFETEIVGGGVAVELGGRDMALLDAQRVERIDSVGQRAKRKPRPEQRGPDRIGLVPWHRHFIGKLAREGDAEEAAAHACDPRG